MKLYHGTSRQNARFINVEGLKAVSIIPELKKLAYVYLSPDIGLAKSYGEVVYEVDTDSLDLKKLDTYQEGIGLIYNYNDDIPVSLLTIC